MAGSLVLAQAAEPEALPAGAFIGLLAGAVLTFLIFLLFARFTVRGIRRLYLRLIPEHVRSSFGFERNTLVLAAVLLATILAWAQTSVQVSGSPTEILVVVGESLLFFAFGLATYLPLVLLLSRSYRQEVVRRWNGVLAFVGIRPSSSAALLFGVMGGFGLGYLFILLPVAARYLRGQVDAAGPGQPDPRPRPAPRRSPSRTSAAANASAQRVIDKAQEALDRARAATSGAGTPDRPQRAPAGPRHDLPERVGRPSRSAATGAPHSTSPGRPSRPVEDQPRRRWWQSGGDARPEGAAGKEPKFRTRSGGDGNAQLTARRRTVKDDEGKPIEIVEIGIDASFRLPRANSPVVAIFELLDVTDASRAPVVIHHRHDSGNVLRTGGPYRSEEQSNVPHTNARLSTTRTVELPELHAPYRGDRTVRARFTLHRPRSPQQPLAQGWVEFPYREDSVGYVEAPKVRLRVESGLATVGFAAIVADGDIGAAEMQLLEQYLAERHKRLGDDGRLAGAARAALDDARLRVRAGASARELLQQAGRDLAEADNGPRESAYELAVRIIAVDGRITELELARLNELAEILQLDATTTAKLRDRHAKVEMFEGDGADPLGVPPGTPQEQRKYLFEQRKKWRAVQANPEKKDQATKMVNLITERIDAIDRALEGTA